MNNLLKQIEKVFDENKLIGNHDFTEDEYSLMVDRVSTMTDNFDKASYKFIFTTLVEIAKRWRQSDTAGNDEVNSGYWDFVFKTLFGTNIDQKLCQKYRNVISWLGNNTKIPVVTSIQKNYYATLMMHSFAQKKSIYSFYDLCYNIFKKDLDFSFTQDDEWLCEIVAWEIKNVLDYGFSEDQDVSIGSSAYSIKIGLKSFALNEDLFDDFIIFIKDTFYHINKLFNREKIVKDSRLKRYIIEWWREKTESEKLADDIIEKKKIPTVSKQNIVAKYLRDDDKVLLCIPSIRIDDNDNHLILSVYLDETKIYWNIIRTKRGELVVSTKPIEFELNDLLKNYNSINIKVEIEENGKIIFDSERNKMTSLYREFILFDNEKEVFSKINKPTNYFVYSKNIDGLKSIPSNLTTYNKNLYNTYPKAGESLIGEKKQVFFDNREKSIGIGKNICLIGSMSDVEWVLEDIYCNVYKNNVKLMIPENFNLKALELKVDLEYYKLSEINYEQFEDGYYQFGLNALGLIPKNEPTEISVYFFEKEKKILEETVILFPNLNIKFNKAFYYGEVERKVTLTIDKEIIELSWDKKENEIKYSLIEGILIIKIPYLRWRIIGGKEWYNEPINKILWYKDFIENGDLLEIDNLKNNLEISIQGKADDLPFEIIKNKTGQYEVGRAIYAHENKNNISIYFLTNEGEKFNVFNVAIKEQFIENPLFFNNGKVFWNVENTFVGDKNNEFFLIIKSAGNNNLRTKISNKNSEIKNLHEDICKVQVKIKDKNIFSNMESYRLIYEGELLIGSPDKLRFKYKKIKLLSANCFDSKKSEWIPFMPKYFINKLKFVQEDENIYYTGQLCVIDRNGVTKVLNTMKNEKGTYDKTNPVRIELRDKYTLWLVAGWEGGNDFIGNLFCDKLRRGICNIQKQDNHFGEINLYKFKEEEDV